MTLNGYNHKKIAGNVLFSVCCQCSTMYGVKSAGEADGGLSHGYCVPCLDDLKKQINERRDDDN